MRKGQTRAPSAAELVVRANGRRDWRELAGKGFAADQARRSDFLAMLRDRLVFVAMEPSEFDACASLEADLPLHDRLEREEADLLVAAVGQIFLVARQVDVLFQELDSTGAVLNDVRAHLATIREEARADCAVRFQLVMVIFGDPPAELENLERPAKRHVYPRVGARLASIQGRLFRLDIRIEGEADGHSVAKGVMTDRKTDVEVSIDISETARDIGQTATGVGKLVPEIGKGLDVGVRTCQRLLAQWVCQQESTDVEVVIFRIGAVNMRDEVAAEWHIDRDVSRPLVRRRPVLH